MYEEDYVKTGISQEKLPFWVARCQHMGGPTRLVDFTMSYDRAVFFALHQLITEDISDDELASVFLINHANLLWTTFQNEPNTRDRDDNRNSWETFQYLLNYPDTGIDDIYWLNIAEAPIEIKNLLGINRIHQQKGLFLYGGDSSQPFSTQLFRGNPPRIELLTDLDLSERLDQTDHSVRNIIKINIPHKECKTILKYLAENRNIRFLTLFPDKPGFFTGIRYDWLINLPGNFRPNGTDISPYSE